MSQRTVLICCQTGDPTATRVANALTRLRGVSVHHADLAQHPVSLSYGQHSTSVRGEANGVDLRDVGAIYWRFAGIPSVPRTASDKFTMLQWTNRQLDAGVRAGLASLPAVWVNHPHCAARTTLPAVLSAAAQRGLDVPETLITTDPVAAKDFLARFDGRVEARKYGVRQAGALPIRHEYRPMAAHELDDSAVPRPHVYRQQITVRHKVRIYSISGTLLSARTDCTAARWTLETSQWRQVPLSGLPSPVVQAIPPIMSGFALAYGAWEFDIDDDGRWWFIDLNPRGSFGTMEDRAGLPIAAAIARTLSQKPQP